MPVCRNPRHGFTVAFLVLALSQCHTAQAVKSFAPRAQSLRKAPEWVFLSHPEGSPMQHPELAPYHHDNKSSALQVGTQSHNGGPKTGYWVVGCFQDKGVDPNRVYYDHLVPKEDRQSMTPLVCFEFCKVQYGMRFFFLGETDGQGRESGVESAGETASTNLCSCGRFYHKSSGKGSLAQCDIMCPGDSSVMCGGHHKESIYQMHDCRAAEAAPTNPWEVRGLRVELAGREGIKFWSGSDEVPGIGSPESAVVKDHPKDFVVVVLDPHDGYLKAAEHFNLDGSLGDGTKDENHASQEALRVDTWVESNTAVNDVVMVAFQARSKVSDVMWGAPVEKALRESGCPLVKKPQANFGFAAICSGRTDAPQSPAQPTGHVSGFVYSTGFVDGELKYALDCQVGDWWEPPGDCSVSCGQGQRNQKRGLMVPPANGGLLCPASYERYIPCNLARCPIDCQYSEWTGFGVCQPECGPGEQLSTRSIVVQMAYDGRPCDQDLEKRQFCQIVPCPIDCALGDWNSWSACNSLCGEGEQERTRGRAVLPQWGGLDCSGPFSESQSCIVRPCPQDCEVGEWHVKDGTPCSTTCGEGVQKEVRDIIVAVAHGGGECPQTERDIYCFEIPCAVDCELSEWTSTICDSSCGGGRLTRTREITTQPQFGGTRCPRSLELVEHCNTSPCAVDCVQSAWGNWGRCSTHCGAGIQKHDRYEEIEAQHGGVPCPGPMEEERDCEVVPCPIACQWGEWKDWGDCSMECGPGRNHRTRTVATHAEHGGAPCDGPEKEEDKCEVSPCPVDCKVSDWRDVGACDRRCGGGQMFQIREVLTESGHGGDSCPPVEQHVECNNHLCPVDCEMSIWQDNGVCSLSCGGGIVQQVRLINTQPQNGGHACPEKVERDFPCNTQPCPVDGVWGEWSGMSGCTAWCGDGTQSRMRQKLVIAIHGGQEAAGVDREVQTCKERECSIDCVWNDWAAWGDCSAACGLGETQRTRDRAVVAQFGGKVCEGAELEAMDCEDTPCPVNCEVTAWEEHGDCTLSCGGGQQTLVRSISVQAMHGGAGCPSNMEKTVPCSEDPCPVDCELSDWVAVSECDVSCGGGVKTEIKNILTAASNGGSMCDVVRSREVECNPEACPVNCEWDSWQPWAPCSTSCDEGESSRSRNKYQEAAHGGAECEGDERESKTCKVSDCPVHCDFSEWSDYSLCDEVCGEGRQEKSRYETVKNQHGGEMCVGPTFEERSCKIKDCSVDCKVSAWKEEVICNQACGGGSRRETRTVEVSAAHGGEECPADLVRDLPCNTEPCAIDCVVGSWTDDGTCTVTCGGGVQRQQRIIQTQPAYGGAACHPERLRFVDCGSDVCPIDCVWQQWTGWGPCSTSDPRSCGIGKRTRARAILVPSAGEGAQCEGPFSEELACSGPPCPVDGVWAQWEAWPACDQQCGWGWHTRQRTLEVVPSSGGLPAPGPREETQRCKDRECPIECKVTAWRREGTCSHTCGDDGRVTEKREIATTAAHGGEECPSELERAMPCNEIPCPVDCVLSDWYDAGECTSSCGAGTLYQKRDTQMAAAHNGVPCEAPLMQFVACNTQPCPINCEYGVWSGWSSCSAECGAGKTDRTREKEIEKGHGGAECLGEESEEADCEIVPCARDCEWDSWQEWDNCNSDCGPGLRGRARAPKVEAAYGGMPCEGAGVESEDCESDPCPVDCEVSDWVTTGQCTASCGGGTQTQQRRVDVPAQNDGAACPGQLVQESPCNEGPCPIDCEVSGWEDRTSCTVTCGGGSLIQIRNRLVRPRYRGVACPSGDTAYQLTVACNSNPCAIHCEFGEWTGYSVCSASCGGGGTTRSRAIAVAAEHGGAECEGELSEALDCNVVSCPVDGVWAGWAEWGVCSEQCGPGFSTRSRTAITEPAHGGYPLVGPDQESRDCEVGPCGVDCVMSAWKDSVACDKSCGTGRKQQQRYIEVSSQHGGSTCATNIAQWVPCNTDPCPIDCLAGAWQAGECTISCGGGTLQKTRTIETAPANGGAACAAYLPLPGETCGLSEELLAECECNKQDCPVDCALEEWGAWSDCSTSCGDGSSTRSRVVMTQAAHDGRACPSGQEHFEASQTCFLAHCPINAQWGEWAQWGACSQACGDGEQERERDLQTAAQHGGSPAEGDATESRSCIVKECPVDCTVGAWEDHGACSKSCGGGQLHQQRQVTTQADHGGQECPPVEQTISCNDDPCPVDCALTTWTKDGSCTKTCGTGKQRFVRSVDVQPTHGGVACEAGRDKEEECNTAECPVDCVTSQWSAWAACSTTCGEGQQTRERDVTTQANHGGVLCPSDLSEHQPCRIAECPIHCEVSAWVEWSTCSSTCGDGGKRDRRRTVHTDPLHGGDLCPELREQEENCNPSPCPVDCVVGAWRESSSCSATCGDGTMEMIRDVEVEPAHGGTTCGDLTQETACFVKDCPVDCDISEWGNDGGCSRQCGGGTQVQRRSTLVGAAHGGKACPEDMERSVECNTERCPGEVMSEIGTLRVTSTGASVVLGVNFQMPAVVLGPVSPPLTTHMESGGNSPFQGSVSAGIASLGQATQPIEAAATFELRSREADKCLTNFLQTSRAEVVDCSGSTNQGWYQDGSFIRSAEDDKCLSSMARPLALVDCDESNQTMLWTMPAAGASTDQITSNQNSECLQHFVAEGDAVLAACEAAPAFSWYRETRGSFYSTTEGSEMAPEGNLGQPLPRIEDCRRECYAQEDCCGFVVVEGQNGCQMKNATTGCAPISQAVGKTSFMKTMSVTAEYEVRASLTPDRSAGAAVLESVSGNINHCIAECFKAADCCGYTVEGAAGHQTCHMFSSCTPVKPAFGTSFHEKADAAQSWVLNIASQGVQGQEEIDVPYFVCESGVYEMTNGKKFQCGVAEVRNTGDEWTEVHYHESFAESPVVVTSVMTRDGGVAMRARQRPAETAGFKVSLESMGGQTVADLKHAVWEKVAWVAMEKGDTVLGGRKASVVQTDNTVDMSNGEVDFTSSYFVAPPTLIGSAMSTHGTETDGLRVQFASREKVELRLDPDTPKDSLMTEEIGLIAVEAGSMAGTAMRAALVSSDVDLAHAPGIEGGFKTPIDGVLISPSSTTNLAGPYADPRFCLKTCIAMGEEAGSDAGCCGVVVLSDGTCWLKDGKSGCTGEEAFPGAQSFVKPGFREDGN